MSRTVVSEGAVHVVVVEDLSAQYQSTQLPDVVTEVAGAACDAVVRVSAAVVALTGLDAAVPAYASRCTSNFVVPLKVTVTLEPGSPSVATRCQIVVSIGSAPWLVTCVQPAGGVWLVAEPV